MQKRWEYPQEMRSLEEGTLTQSSKTPTQLLLLPALRTAELTTYQCLWFPTRPPGIVPPQWSGAPLETQLSHAAGPAGLSHSHTHAHPAPFPCSSSPGGNGKGALEPAGSWLSTLPRQAPPALLLLPPQHRDSGRENEPVPRQHHLKAPLPQPSHSISTLSGRPARR